MCPDLRARAQRLQTSNLAPEKKRDRLRTRCFDRVRIVKMLRISLRYVPPPFELCKQLVGADGAAPLH
jgi:hypothetical protein